MEMTNIFMQRQFQITILLEGVRETTLTIFLSCLDLCLHIIHDSAKSPQHSSQHLQCQHGRLNLKLFHFASVYFVQCFLPFSFCLFNILFYSVHLFLSQLRKKRASWLSSSTSQWHRNHQSLSNPSCRTRNSPSAKQSGQ